MTLLACNTIDDGKLKYKVVRIGGQYGYIDRLGEVAIQPQFAYALEFSEKMGGVNVGGTPRGDDMPIDGKWGFVDSSGRFLINPQFYSPQEMGAPYDLHELALAEHEGYMFSEGVAAVINESQEWVFIDKQGRAIPELSFPGIRSARKFTNGLANVYVKGKWGYLNRAGEMVIEPQFLYPVNFHDSVVVVMDASRKKIVINQLGERLLPQYQIESQFYDGYASVKAMFRGEAGSDSDERKYGLVDLEGRLPFDPMYDQIGRYGSGMVPVLVGSKVGNPVIHPNPVKPTENTGGKWGFINLNGQFVRNPTYQEAKGFSEGLASVKQGGLWGYMREDGSMLTGFEFRWTDYFKDGLAVVQLGPYHNDYDGQFAYVNKQGEVLWIEKK
ncbi:MAG: WG repeat-containing protein [Bacteroidota bacterium]